MALGNLGCDSGMEVRVGMIKDVVEHMLDWYEETVDGSRGEVAGIWMTSEEGTEEEHDEGEVRQLAKKRGVELKVWDDEKYYIDECVASFANKSNVCFFHTS